MHEDEEFILEMKKVDAQIAQVETRYFWAHRHTEGALELVGLAEYKTTDKLTTDIVEACIAGSLTPEGKADLQKAAQYALMAAYRLINGARKSIAVLKDPNFQEGDDAFPV